MLGGNLSPCKGKSFKTPGNIKLLPLQGALLIAFIPRAMPWAKSFCPYRACCSLELLTFTYPSPSDFEITLSPTRLEAADALRLWYAVRDNPVPYTP